MFGYREGGRAELSHSARQGALLDFTAIPTGCKVEFCLLLMGTKQAPIVQPRIEGLRIRSQTGFGLAIGHFRNASLSGCTVEQSGLAGLYCFFGTGCLIFGNHVLQGGDNGISTFTVDDVVINANVVEHSRGTGGIAVMQGEGLTITGNTVRDSDIAAIGTWDVAREVLISGNVVLGSRNMGIEDQGNGDWDNRTRDVVVSGNLISRAA